MSLLTSRSKMGIFNSVAHTFAKAKLYALVRTGVLGTPYQPVPYARVAKRELGTQRRWEAISAFLASRTPGSVLDIGCNCGFYSIELSRLGYVCLGIDRSQKALYIANLAREVRGVPHVCFMDYSIDTETVNRLPHFDITLCLSVFHHWALKYGADDAITIMQKIAERTNNLLFFETAETNSCSEKYRRVLPDMGPVPRVWLESFLTGLGFREARSLGAFSRELMVAVK